MVQPHPKSCRFRFPTLNNHYVRTKKKQTAALTCLSWTCTVFIDVHRFRNSFSHQNDVRILTEMMPQIFLFFAQRTVHKKGKMVWPWLAVTQHQLFEVNLSTMASYMSTLLSFFCGFSLPQLPLSLDLSTTKLRLRTSVFWTALYVVSGDNSLYFLMYSLWFWHGCCETNQMPSVWCCISIRYFTEIPFFRPVSNYSYLPEVLSQCFRVSRCYYTLPHHTLCTSVFTELLIYCSSFVTYKKWRSQIRLAYVPNHVWPT